MSVNFSLINKSWENKGVFARQEYMVFWGSIQYPEPEPQYRVLDLGELGLLSQPKAAVEAIGSRML